MDFEPELNLVNFSDLTIRLITYEDLPALEWDGEFSHFRRLYREIYKSTLDGRGLMWVAEINQKGLIGQVFIRFQSGRPELANGIDRAYLFSFRILPQYRKRGIGSFFLDTVEKDLVSRNYSWVTLNVARDNPSALRFYLQHGYRIVDSEPGYWTYLDEKGITREVHEPAWRMQKYLVK